jgi:hypothetical protein
VPCSTPCKGRLTVALQNNYHTYLMNNTRKAKLAALAIIPTLAVSALAGTVFAASATTTTSTATSSLSRFFKDRGPQDSTQFATDLASVLGLNATDVKAKLDAGTKPSDIITAAGKTEANVQTAIKALHDAAMKTHLSAEVTAGTMTQAQADAIIAHEATETHGGHHGGFGGIKTTTTSSITSTQ